MNLSDVLAGVEGWLADDEAQLLHDLAAQIRLPQMIVEVGTYRGRSMIAMALDAGVPLFGIDPHVPSDGDPFAFGDADRQVLMANLVKTGVAWKVRLLDVQSEFAARGWPGHRIGLLYIDGAHNSPAVAQDLDGWLPYVDDGGWVAFHDSYIVPVQDGVNHHPELDWVQTVGSVALYRYHRQPTVIEKLEPVVQAPNDDAERIGANTGLPPRMGVGSDGVYDLPPEERVVPPEPTKPTRPKGYTPPRKLGKKVG